MWERPATKNETDGSHACDRSPPRVVFCQGEYLLKLLENEDGSELGTSDSRKNPSSS
jgi:hypothetical protein